ncbi:hypothetical protein SUGI_0996390 [Cryptomeria japonica]|nr:hypothetical protein SUGI_0996390 [Cryptomeria japonica]
MITTNLSREAIDFTHDNSQDSSAQVNILFITNILTQSNHHIADGLRRCFHEVYKRNVMVETGYSLVGRGIP